MVLSTLKPFSYFHRNYTGTVSIEIAESQVNLQQHDQSWSFTFLSNPLGQQAVGKLAMLFCLILIAAVSAHDTYLAVDNEQIMKVEQNPICLSLIRLDPDNFTFFILGKSVGTISVVVSLLLLTRFRYRHALPVTYTVAAFQVGLLGYLHLSDPLIGGLPNLGLLFQ